MHRPRVRFENYTFAYSGQKSPALSDVTADVSGPALCAVLGRSGVGKTSMLRAVAGLLEHIYPGTTTGATHIESGAASNAAEATNPALARRHNLVSAYFEGESQLTLTTETVREEIQLALLAKCGSRALAATLTDSTARELDIVHLMDRGITELSGGEEKLVGLAACLASPTAVYVLDEPFEQLDPRRVNGVLSTMQRRRRSGALVMFATSLLDLALNESGLALIHANGVWNRFAPPDYSLLDALAPELGESPGYAMLLSQGNKGHAGIKRFRQIASALRD